MANYLSMTKAELESEFAKVKVEFEKIKEQKLSLDMSRGKPASNQLDLSDGLLDLVGRNYKSENGTDCRNYGGLDGLPEVKKLFSELLEMPTENIICGGYSSLILMFDTITQGMVTGFGNGGWASQGKVKFLCPSPGYDRHFGVCEYYGIEMIPIKYNADGPDMDTIEQLVKDPSVKGMWCVPKYSNPLGITYSDEIVRRIAALKPAAKDFRIMWDNAYIIHDLYDDGDRLLNIFDECKKQGNEDMVFIFTSTSKITYSGAGVSAVAASDANIKLLKSRMTVQTIGPNKLTHLCHARMFGSKADLVAHMKRHADILRPKFEACLDEFENSLGSLGIARWTMPRGGYFISMDVLSGCAKRVGQLCREAGLVITTPGATFPYGNDPDDSNLRIAPSFPTADELKVAATVLCTAVKYAALEKIIG
ncbi:MAG: aminotransferase class I/II-fold pyridoxal phosphate-dependent enzyme [Clostridia bacterium]|nr:aminotransferase class I/II-fold pyridoxal phosphate-dependent enzyme [Clostridia bacterium]